ncbi:hypothetical protein, partial [Anaplasma phagocytophilum]|uniref:hypothetical protein n=1 Tax=Anaplasma phagocytophilum TaxID=948 RepID=UPI0018C86B84
MDTSQYVVLEYVSTYIRIMASALLISISSRLSLCILNTRPTMNTGNMGANPFSKAKTLEVAIILDNFSDFFPSILGSSIPDKKP